LRYLLDLRSFPTRRSSDLFSMMMYLGLTSPQIRYISDHNPLRLPLIPSMLPATDISWHGNPPLIMSTYLGFRSVLTSSYCSVCCQCLASLFLLCFSYSQFHSVSICASSAPFSNPPIPENSDP